MPNASRTAAAIAVACTLAATPVPAAEPSGGAPLCSPTVSAALSAWDKGMEVAGKFGDKAVGLAREKGREYILPLFGVEKSAAGADDQTDAVSRALEATRQDPQARLDLCIAVTDAVEQAKASAGAGIDALRRAAERFAPAAPPPPKAAPPDGQGLIKT